MERLLSKIQPDTQETDTQETVKVAAQILQAGGVVAYPTETVWGLAAHPDHPLAIARLFELKGRDPSKPLQVSCP